MKKLVMFASGGTIAMKRDEISGGLIPALSGADLIKAVPELSKEMPAEVVDFSLEPSSRITPAVMLDLAVKAEESLNDEEVAGVVVTHGTDTLEETAYFLNLFIDSEKPVCVTGAMRSAAEVSPDGAANLLSAVRTASCRDARGTGVTVVMNGEIHSAEEVTKSHALDVSSFVSPFWGPLGREDAGRVIFKRRPFSGLTIKPRHAEADVPLVKLYTGMDNGCLEYFFNRGADGLVIEAFGRGNMSNVHCGALKKFLDAGIPVVLATRTFGGRVAGIYAYEGGGMKLIESGMIPAGEITAAKARLKLIMALGAGYGPEKIKECFDKLP